MEEEKTRKLIKLLNINIVYVNKNSLRVSRSIQKKFYFLFVCALSFRYIYYIAYTQQLSGILICKKWWVKSLYALYHITIEIWDAKNERKPKIHSANSSSTRQTNIKRLDFCSVLWWFHFQRNVKSRRNKIRNYSIDRAVVSCHLTGTAQIDALRTNSISMIWIWIFKQLLFAANLLVCYFGILVHIKKHDSFIYSFIFGCAVLTNYFCYFFFLFLNIFCAYLYLFHSGTVLFN